MPEFLGSRAGSRRTLPKVRRKGTRSTGHVLRQALSTLATGALATFAVVTLATPADATVQQQTGRLVTPGQPYGGKERSADWLGSYLVNGKQVFCVEYEYRAPDTDEQYRPHEELRTKWGDSLPPDLAANISYLLLRYGDTKNPDQAAALAHLLHSWTAPPRPGKDDLNPAKDFRNIGYDAPFHFAKLPPTAHQAVSDLTADAPANRGPWTATTAAPKDPQTIGTAADWTITVRNAAGKGIGRVPVTFALTDATRPDGSAKGTVTTGDDGTVRVRLTPTGTGPKLLARLSAPANRPYAEVPVDTNTQRVVATGGEQELTTEASTPARNQPGSVRITKLDAKSGKGIAGVALRLTAGDRTAAATGRDGNPLVGSDGRPAVLTTGGESGAVSAENLQTPQEVCVVEVSPPDGYDQAFDAVNPPSACGTVRPGETLALTVSNVPNEVPTVIPAGSAPTIISRAQTTTVISPLWFAALGVLVVLGSALVGFVARRRPGK